MKKKVHNKKSMLRKLTWSKNSSRSAQSTGHGNHEDSQMQPQSTGPGNHEDSQMAVLQGDGEYDKEEKSLSRFCPCFKTKDQSSATAENKEQLPSPWALHADEELSPRSSVWLYLAAVSLMGLGTLLVVEGSSESVGLGRSDDDRVTLAMFSTCFSISLALCIGYRHRSVRNAFTCDLRWIHFSVEFLLSVVLFCLWCVIMSMLLDPFGAMNFAITTVSAADSTQIIWNINLWVCAWLGYGLLASLVGSLLLVSPMRKRATWPREVLSKTKRHRYEFEESRWTYWFMCLAFQLALSVFSLKLRNGQTCTGALGSTPFCERSNMGTGVGLVNAIISCASLLFCRLDQMGKFDHWGANRQLKIWCIECCFSLISLAMACLNLAYSTRPGGPATELGNMFVTSIVGVALSLMLCEQILNSCMVRAFAAEEDASEFEQSMQPEEQLDVEKGRRRIYTPRLSDSDDESSSSSGSSSDSSSSSSSEGLHESIYPPEFEQDESESSYSLPEPAPVNTSISSTTNNASRYDEYRADVSIGTANVNVPPSDDESDFNSESGVDLCFEPDDDVSSIDCSIPSKMAASRVSRASSIDPDGYKSEDNYDARETKVPTASNIQYRSTRRKTKKSTNFNRNEVLESVSEQKVTHAKSDGNNEE